MSGIVEQLLINELTGLVKSGNLTEVVQLITGYLTTIGRSDLAQHWTAPVVASHPATPVKPAKPTPHGLPPHIDPTHPEPPHPEAPTHAPVAPHPEPPAHPPEAPAFA